MKPVTPHQSAALDYKRHIFLTANAGSGKTFVMAARFIEIALNENVSPENIAAITFTEKAAGELYSRISDQLESRIASEKDELRLSRLKKIRDELVFAAISTIHSFCLDILKAFPVEAGLDAAFIPVDQNTSDMLIAESAAEAVNISLRDEKLSEQVKDLIRLTGSKKNLTAVIIALLQKRMSMPAPESLPYNKDEEKAADELFSRFLKTAGELLLPVLHELTDNIAKINQAVLSYDTKNAAAEEVRSDLKIIAEARKETEAPRLEEIITRLNFIYDRIFTKSGSIRKTGYLKATREERAEEIKKLEESFDLVRSLSIPEDHHLMELELAGAGKKLMMLSIFALERYSEKKSSFNQVDFEDLLIKTRELIKNPEILNILSSRFRYVMIDEYQDTNEIQYEIFLSILNYLRKGNLFVVGDEKQSIYMFRDADLEVFERTKDDIAFRSGEKSILNLPESFRMTPQLCLFINTVAKGLFIDPDPFFNEVGHNPLVCAGNEDSEGGVEFLIAEDSEDENEEAELTAKRILQLNSAGTLSFGEIAVLCRKRKSFDGLEAAFLKYGVPFAVTGGRGFFRQQVVYDILNYLTFVLDPQDDAALAGILRSPFFFLSDSELFEVSLEKGRSLYEKMQNYSRTLPSVKRITEILEDNIASAGRTDVTRFLRKITGETAYLSALAAKSSGVQEIADVEKLISLSKGYFYEGSRTVYDFRNYLARAVESDADEAEAEITADENSVKIMTIHQAKGLEFKAVFIYGADEYSTGDEVRQSSVRIDKNLGIMALILLNDDYEKGFLQAPAVRLHNYITRRKRIAEIKRLLYVAATRAKNYLFFTAAKGRSRFSRESFIGLILKALNTEELNNELCIESDLEFLKFQNSSYYNSSEKLTLKIPVVREIEMFPEADPDMEAEKTAELRDLSAAIESSIKGEIYTSSQLAIFMTDLLLYRKIFIQGIARLEYNLGKAEYNIDAGYGEIKEYKYLTSPETRILHSLLHRRIADEKYIEKVIRGESVPAGGSHIHTDEIKLRVMDSLERMKKSSVYKMLTERGDVEYNAEVIIPESDFFLTSVIDSLYTENETCTVTCFRNDHPHENTDKDNRFLYYNQAMIYAFVLKKLHPGFKHVRVRFLFTSNPDIPYELTFSATEIYSFKDAVYSAVSRIREIAM